MEPIETNRETATFWGYFIMEMPEYLDEEMDDARRLIDSYNDQARVLREIANDIRHICTYHSSEIPYSREFLSKVDCNEIAELIYSHVRYGYPLRPLLLWHRHEEQKRRVFLKTIIGGKTKIQTEDFGGNVGPVIEANINLIKEKVENIQKMAAACLVKAQESKEVASA